MASDAERQKVADVVWLEREAAFWDTQRSDHGDRLRRIIGYVRERERLETTLDYVASCFHVAIHGIKDAPTWQECDLQPCRTANGSLPSVRHVDPRPSTVATPDAPR